MLYLSLTTILEKTGNLCPVLCSLFLQRMNYALYICDEFGQITLRREHLMRMVHQAV